MSDEAVPGALEMAALLDEFGVPYVLGGSLASSLVGEPRTTMGVDVAVELDARRAQELVVALVDEWYASPEAAAEAVRLRASFNVIHLATMLKVDLFVLGGGLLDRRQLARRRRLPIGDAGELWSARRGTRSSASSGGTGSAARSPSASGVTSSPCSASSAVASTRRISTTQPPS